MIYKTKEELLECMLYWQQRALEAERELESELDYERFLVDETLMYQMRFYELEDNYEILEAMYNSVVLDMGFYKGLVESRKDISK